MTTLRPMLLLLLFLPMFTACDDDDLEHDPPEGQSGLIVVNDTPSEMSVFLDGIPIQDVDAFDDRTYNLEPGVHRIILDPDDSRSTYQDEIELLVNRTLILLVSGGSFDEPLHVEMRLD